MTTRYNEETWAANQAYRQKHHLACVYCAPYEISDTIPLMDRLLVIEMNNSLNRVEGIGLVRNKPHVQKVRVHADTGSSGFNRVAYIGKHYVSRDQLLAADAELVQVLETLLFVGRGHSKRGLGISRVPPVALTRHPRGPTLLRDIRRIFLSLFSLSESSGTTSTSSAAACK